jgi:hypothetical protein
VEITDDASVIPTVIRDASSNDKLPEDVPSPRDDADDADYDKGQNFSEAKRAEPLNPDEKSFPRGSVSELAKRWKASGKDIRESLKAWEECGRIVIVGEDIYERPGKAYPKKDLPEEDDGQDDEDASPPGPEKGEEDPGDSSPRGDAPGEVKYDPFAILGM